MNTRSIFLFAGITFIGIVLAILLAVAPDAVACPGPEMVTQPVLDPDLVSPNQLPVLPRPGLADNLELNQAFLFASVFGLLGTLYMLLRKQSSMWIIGGAMMALFAFIGFMCV